MLYQSYVVSNCTCCRAACAVCVFVFWLYNTQYTVHSTVPVHRSCTLFPHPPPTLGNYCPLLLRITGTSCGVLVLTAYWALCCRKHFLCVGPRALYGWVVPILPEKCNRPSVEGLTSISL